MANHLRLQPGKYTADRPVCLTLMRDGVEREFTKISKGDVIEVPRTTNRHWYAATYYPNIGEDRPILTAVAE